MRESVDAGRLSRTHRHEPVPAVVEQIRIDRKTFALQTYAKAIVTARESAAAMRDVAMKTPGVLNTLQAADVPLFDEKLSVADARALAPHLVRNPHPQAALVRGYAAAGTNSFKAVVTAIMKSERWRLSGDHKTSAARLPK